MTGHPCPYPGCTKRVPYEMLACNTHYRMLPNRLRNRLYRTWGMDGAGAGSAAHTAAIDDCVAFWRHQHATLANPDQGVIDD